MKVLINYNLDNNYVEELKRTFPNVEFSKVVELVDMNGAIADADVLLAGRFNAELFAQAKKLKWVQSSSADVESRARSIFSFINVEDFSR